MKYCPKCQTKKPLGKFQKSGQNINGYYCKVCCQHYHKIYDNIHKDQIKIKNKICYEINKNHYRTYRKIYHKTHRDLHNVATIKYLTNRENRIPPWADLEAIKRFYVKATRITKKTNIQHDVDHIIPLHGKNVSGLHVENNLQIITHIRNCQKSNSWRL